MNKITTYIIELNSRSDKLNAIYLDCTNCTNVELNVLVGCLAINPNVLRCLVFRSLRLCKQLINDLCVFLSTSQTIAAFSLTHTGVYAWTYRALAKTLYANTSLTKLSLYNNYIMDKLCVDVIFINALRLNPIRSSSSEWFLYSKDRNEFKRLKRTAAESTSPSMLEFLLCLHLKTEILETIRH